MSGAGAKGSLSLFPSEDSGSIPTAPLHPKDLKVLPGIRKEMAYLWIHKHYLHRDFSNPSIEFAVVAPDGSLVGGLAYSALLGGSKKGGHKHTLELRRFFLEDYCEQNSESRVLSYTLRWIARHMPHINNVVSYSDIIKRGHKGTIYRACGFRVSGRTKVDPKGKGWATHKRHITADNWPKIRWVYYIRRTQREHYSREKTGRKNSLTQQLLLSRVTPGGITNGKS